MPRPRRRTRVPRRAQPRVRRQGRPHLHHRPARRPSGVFFGAPDPSRDPAYAAEAERVAVRIATLLASPAIPRVRPRRRHRKRNRHVNPRHVIPRRRRRAARVPSHARHARRARPDGGARAPTCDLLVLDRSSDVARRAREWTYEAMVHDLLPVSPSACTGTISRPTPAAA